MQTVTLEQAREQFDGLIHKAACGEPFQITQNGHALAQVAAPETNIGPAYERFGFMRGIGTVPLTFSRDGDDRITESFEPAT